jgi:hypothetical protein
VDEARGLRLHDLDHGRRTMADGEHPDAADEVEQRVAVDVVDQCALGALDGDVGGFAEARGDGARAPRQHRPAVGSRHFRDKSNRSHLCLPSVF